MSSHEIELLLRFQVSAHYARGYEMDFWYGGTALQMVRWNGPIGDFTVLDNSGPGPQGLVTGDIVKAQMIGNTITVFKNGNVISTYVDYAFTDGNPGMGFFVRPGGTPDQYCFTRFTAATTDSGAIQGGGSPRRHPRKLAVSSADPLLNRIRFRNGSEYPELLEGVYFDASGRSFNAGAAMP